MSYEGSVEYISERGEYWVIDCMEEGGGILSPRLLEPPKWRRSVDYTNGYIDDDPNTHGSVEGVHMFHNGEYHDIWNVDRFGNKYCISMPLYSPNLDYWRAARVINTDWEDYATS